MFPVLEKQLSKPVSRIKSMEKVYMAKVNNTPEAVQLL